MVGAARRLATELVVISARATQEIQTAGGHLRAGHCLFSAAHVQPHPQVPGVVCATGQAELHRLGRGVDNLNMSTAPYHIECSDAYSMDLGIRVE